jgi:TonB family protein
MKMLPQGIYPISKIEQEYAADTQVTKLVSLLGYLLSLINPNVMPKDGKNVGFGERVNANRNLFTNVPDIFFAIGVRNCIVHPENCEKPYTEAEIKRAAKHLRNAIYEIRDHSRIPADVKRDVFQPAAPRAAAPNSQTAPPPNFPPRKKAKPLNFRRKPKPVVARSAGWLLSLRPRRPGRWVAALVVGALLSVYGKTIWQFGQEKFFGTRSDATIRRKEADEAIKRMQQFDKRQGFAAKVAEAQAAWREAEIAFHQQRFKDAEQGYRRVSQIWDELVVRQNDRNEAQKLLAEIQSNRANAQNAQAPQVAPQLWREAEQARLAARTALTNGNFAEARQLALKAKQKYEEAAGLAPSSTPAPGGPIATPTPYIEAPSAASHPPPTAEGPALKRRERPAEDPSPSNESEDNGIFLIYQKEFMRYVKKQVTPSLPPEAKAQGVSGPVKVEVVLSKNGYLAKARVIEGHPLIRQAALDALRQWQFKPYQRDRVPVDVRSEIAINFR